MKHESKRVTLRMALIFSALVILMGAITLLAPTYKPKPVGKIALRCLGVATRSNAEKSIFMTISNPNPETIVYFVCDPELKSNGSWPHFQHPVSERMNLLSPGQWLLLSPIKASATNGEARVPVLWGTLSVSKRERLRDEVAAFLRMPNSARVRRIVTNGFYTDYLEGIQLDNP